MQFIHVPVQRHYVHVLLLLAATLLWKPYFRKPSAVLTSILSGLIATICMAIWSAADSQHLYQQGRFTRDFVTGCRYSILPLFGFTISLAMLTLSLAWVQKSLNTKKLKIDPHGLERKYW